MLLIYMLPPGTVPPRLRPQQAGSHRRLGTSGMHLLMTVCITSGAEGVEREWQFEIPGMRNPKRKQVDEYGSHKEGRVVRNRSQQRRMMMTEDKQGCWTCDGGVENSGTP